MFSSFSFIVSWLNRISDQIIEIFFGRPRCPRLPRCTWDQSQAEYIWEPSSRPGSSGFFYELHLPYHEPNWIQYGMPVFDHPNWEEPEEEEPLVPEEDDMADAENDTSAD